MKAIEFFYFYLMPEVSRSDARAQAEATRNPSGDKKPGHRTQGGEGATTRSTQEKQQMLGKYLSNVSELVQDLQETAPFEITA